MEGPPLPVVHQLLEALLMRKRTSQQRRKKRRKSRMKTWASGCSTRSVRIRQGEGPGWKANLLLIPKLLPKSANTGNKVCLIGSWLFPKDKISSVMLQKWVCALSKFDRLMFWRKSYDSAKPSEHGSRRTQRLLWP